MRLHESDKLRVHPARNLAGEIVPPASKSSSTRAVLAATLAQGSSRIENIANSNNVRAMIACCEELGAACRYEGPNDLCIDGPGADGLRDGVTLDPGNSGIVLRLLLGAAAGLSNVTFVTRYDRSLGQRANIEMMRALEPLGVRGHWRGEDGRLPIRLDGSGLRGGATRISARKSSQFLSGLLFLGGALREPLSIRVEDELKAPDMVRTTLRVLERAGVPARAADDMMSYEIAADTRFQPATHRVGSDPASTAALLAVAAVVESDVRLTAFQEEEMGGGAVVEHLRQVGVAISQTEGGLRVRGGGPFAARDFDGSLAPDAVLPLAAVAAFAEGVSRFTNIEHLRYKECDRISDFRRELLKAGVQAEERRDELIVHGQPAGIRGGAEIDGHFDHGVIMALSAIALGSHAGLTINAPRHVAQTYPDFFTDLRSIGGAIEPFEAAA